jgi:hypothetical protein
MPVATPTRCAAPNPTTFEDLLTRAARTTSLRTYALDYGVDDEALVRYTSGAVSDEERVTIEHVIGRCAWAQERVVALVKKRRPWQKRNAA